MSVNKKLPTIALIAGEFAFGIALSLIFFKIIISNDSFFGYSYGGGIVSFYAILSAVFFIAVFSVGIYGAIILGKSKRIANALLYSVLAWVFTMILYTATFSFFSYSLNLRILHLYMILVGIITGFNLGLKAGSNTESDVYKRPSQPS